MIVYLGTYVSKQTLAILSAHSCELYFFASCLYVCSWHVLYLIDPFRCKECRDRICDLRRHLGPQNWYVSTHCKSDFSHRGGNIYTQNIRYSNKHKNPNM